MITCDAVECVERSRIDKCKIKPKRADTIWKGLWMCHPVATFTIRDNNKKENFICLSYRKCT